MMVIAGVFERPWQLPMPGLATWLALLVWPALSTALAYIVFFQILRRSGPTNVMLVTLLIPVTAILLGYLVLGETISLARDPGRAGDRQRAVGDRWPAVRFHQRRCFHSESQPVNLPLSRSPPATPR